MKGFSSGGTLLDTAAVVLEEGPYNVVTVAVGINDLLRGGYMADQIMSLLTGLYDKILWKGYPVIAIPPLPAPGFVAK
jgi:lysophospholipase L1-like esterase